MGKDKQNNELVAIKFMPRDQRHKTKFDKEVAVFDELNKLDKYPTGFPRLIMKGRTNHFFYYIMEKLGKCLKKLHSLCPNDKMDLRNVLNIGLQMIERLETLHSVNLVHKDIKPANI